MFSTLRNYLQKHQWMRKFVAYYLAPSGLFDGYFKNYKPSRYWQKRIDDVLLSPDLALIPKVANAGKIKRGKQIMHNGLLINLGSYYGPEYSKMLMLSKGVHEPQEERIFMEVIKLLKPGSVMIELGSFWSFYSMWFNKDINQAINIMVEPDSFNIGQGKRNFRLNKMKGKFIQAFIGNSYSLENKILTVDRIVEENNIEFIHILHSDIQGFEYEMLLGAEKTMLDAKVGHYFISTHSNEIHYKCLELLKQTGNLIITSIDLDETFSEDGLIVAKNKNSDMRVNIPITKRFKNEV